MSNACVCACVRVRIMAKYVQEPRTSICRNEKMKNVYVCVKVHTLLSSDFPRDEFVYTGSLEHNGCLFHSKC